ncbi:hypothetical protein BDN71DRAFT_119348 [Pleurotus eryngii]|uniref:Uncharacterized protein n=1 Tax=Pleurotus eryngii TaxID=5323 RepID=A0A9P6DIU9_PLEER|nr:hypothetical protein BDN71DRAFT_119348 [Pleurotus eryngii]
MGSTSQTPNINHSYSVHRRTTSVDSSYSAFFTSGLLSPPSSPAMSPTSPSTSTSPFSSPFTNRHQPPNSRNPKLNAHRALPSTSMLELASPSSSYDGDALYFVALLQQMEDSEHGEEDPINEDEDNAEGGGGEGEKERDLRELTSFLSLDASSPSQYTRSTKTRTGRPTTLSSSTTRFPFPASHLHSSYPDSRPNSNTREQPRSPTASTSSTSTSTSTSASVSPITPPSYPFSQQRQRHPCHPHPYHADSNSHQLSPNSHNITKTSTITKSNQKTDASGKTVDHPRSFLPSLRHHALDAPNTHAPTCIPSLTLPPPVVSSFVFDDSSDSSPDSDDEDECDLGIPLSPTHNPGKHIQARHSPRTGAQTAPLLASFPAPPPTSLALRLSLHLPKTSLFFDDLEKDSGDVGELQEAVRESYLSLTFPTSPPPQPHQQRATRKPSNPPSHTRKPSTTRRSVGSRKSGTRRTPTAHSPLACTPSNALSFSRPFTRSPSQKAKWRGKRFTQVSTTSSASVSTGYRTCMRADALAALEGRVLGSREASGRGGGGDDEIAKRRKDETEEEGGEGGEVSGEVLMSTWSDEEDGEDLWEDDEEDGSLLVQGEEQEQEWAEVEGGGEGEGERRAEMSWMDFNEFGGKGKSRGLSSKSYKWKSMYSISTSVAAFAATADTEEEEEEGRPFSASSTSLPNLPFPSATSTSAFPSTLSASSQASTLSSQTVQFEASSPTSTSAAMLSPLSFALPSRPQIPPPLREGREKKERGKGMTSFMFIDADERTARSTREKAGFGKSFIDF